MRVLPRGVNVTVEPVRVKSTLSNVDRTAALGNLMVTCHPTAVVSLTFDTTTSPRNRARPVRSIVL